MKSAIFYWLAAMMLFWTGIIFCPSLLAESTPSGHVRSSPGRFVGRITAVSQEVKQITVLREDAPVSMNFVVGFQTLLVKSGHSIKFADLALGDLVRVRYADNSDVRRVDVLVPKPPQNKPARLGDGPS